ncbi:MULTISPECIES: large conductance mechanosensitive channel protein MscL [unclassified Butyrivibrio]|uniref:large conductance mechanosensitive channel protein MscL n=1 Tax=unclassified Butyrivibrio TaxID=2639466 RepID=UPI0008E2E2A5|nr:MULTISPECIES: large conductance mechanosensitive channel protein MscL [unclassified Butyrivibrio]RKM62706.1 large conductance mechanosensitive channel protein MscL [Butyrivibrio sp. XB500-5]SFU46922.1 large conductance mechanosensitive channel [Butyrivibrio sp. INlla21]
MKDKISNVAGKGKGLAAEFREFIMRGNVLDMAVGVIIGGAFQKIISSLVDDIIMPFISIITGGIDFNNMFFTLDGGTYATLEAAKEAGAVTVNYGTFITVVIDFLLMALVIFALVKCMNNVSNKFKKEQEEAPATTKICPRCKSEIAIDATRCPHCTSELTE